MARPEYLKILSRLNINNEDVLLKEIIASIMHRELQTYITNLGPLTIDRLASELLTIEKAASGSDAILAKKARDARLSIYDRVLFPSKELKNTAGIFRIGTFLTFYISENRTRYLDDSLITSLDRYIKGNNRDETLENIKKLGTKYLLIDLNAATIDRDPRHDLTRRYEMVLDLLRSKKLKLIETDSMCLKTALENKDAENFPLLAGVNYYSYAKTSDGKDGVITPEAKMNLCRSVMAAAILSNRVSEKEYSFLEGYKTQAAGANITNPDELIKRLPAFSNGWLAAFEIE